MIKNAFTLEQLNGLSKNTLVDHLVFEITELTDDYIKATMPVDERTVQPMGLLHGGASVVLAETLGSLGATTKVDMSKQYCVGLDINANHIKSARSGLVEGIAKPIHIGKKTQVWEINITNEAKELVCVSRITMAVIDIKK
jgi:1,4-dihydroxy-2-naphthoyl-CoA hydrolase